MSRSRAEAALAQLGEKLGIPGLALNASGVCQLVFEQRWVTTLVHDAALHRIVLHCPLCAAPQTQTLSANTLRGLLQASFRRDASSGAGDAAEPGRALGRTPAGRGCRTRPGHARMGDSQSVSRTKNQKR